MLDGGKRKGKQEKKKEKQRLVGEMAISNQMEIVL